VGGRSSHRGSHCHAAIRTLTSSRPKPSFILKLQKADVLVTVGKELEESAALPPLIQQSRNAKVQVGAGGYLDASAQARILDIPQGQITRAMGDVLPQGNPHYWLDSGQPAKPSRRRSPTSCRSCVQTTVRTFQQRLNDFVTRLSDAEKALGDDDGAVQGHEGRDLPSLVPQLC
jgi:zinc/manganese transport system substrate-binding protein